MSWSVVIVSAIKPAHSLKTVPSVLGNILMFYKKKKVIIQTKWISENNGEHKTIVTVMMNGNK